MIFDITDTIIAAVTTTVNNIIIIDISRDGKISFSHFSILILKHFLKYKLLEYSPITLKC